MIWGIFRLLPVNCTPNHVCSNDDGKCEAELPSDNMVMEAVYKWCEFTLLVTKQNHSDIFLPVLHIHSSGEWPLSVVVWSCHHYAVLYGFESHHSPHPSRLLVPNKLMSHCTNAADRKQTPWKCRLMSHEPSSLCQTHHRSSKREISDGGGLGGGSMALVPSTG